MHLQKKLEKRLAKHFGTAVKVAVNNDIVTLSGTLEGWQQVVFAGQLCADKKRRWMLVNDIYCPENKSVVKISAIKDTGLENKSPDVLIIGGGIVGCAIARELMRNKITVLLAEKEHDLALHASGRNDGMVHPGIDLRKGQVKQKYNARGNVMFEEISKQLEVPFKRTGQLLCFNKPWMKPLLFILPLYWKSMGVECRYVGKKELQALEPNVNKALCCALSFPAAGIVCPYNLTIAYAENAVQNGAQISLDTSVLAMTVENQKINAVHTNRGTIYPKIIINAAGAFCEDIAKMAQDRFYSVHPRKGTNSILDKKAAYMIRTIASEMSTAATKTTHSKGGGIVSTIDGNLLVGPNAKETWEKENFETEAESINAVFEKQKKAVPTLSQNDIITYFTGVRAATYEEDFVIEYGRNTKNIIHAAGIQSPGLTAAPAIAQDVAKMAAELLKKLGISVIKNETFNEKRTAIPRPTAMNISERNALITANPDYGEIVCRCEEVSKGEIISALHRNIPCDTIDGVKRRVRAGMGRCQGGFCGPLVAQIISQELGVPLECVQKSGEGSQILVGATKEVLQNERPCKI